MMFLKKDPNLSRKTPQHLCSIWCDINPEDNSNIIIIATTRYDTDNNTKTIAMD